MKKMILACLGALPLAFPALAQTGAANDPPVATNGPLASAPKKEKDDQQEIDAFWKQWGNAWKSGEALALARMVDFPVLLLTDDAKGTFSESELDQSQWLPIVNPMVAMAQERKAEERKAEERKAEERKADAEASKHGSRKSRCFVLSDNLASCEAEVTVHNDRYHGDFHRQALLTRTGSGWKIKSMVEAGWGGSHPASASHDVDVWNDE